MSKMLCAVLEVASGRAGERGGRVRSQWEPQDWQAVRRRGIR